MHVSKEDFDRLQKESKRENAARELDIKGLLDVICGFVRLFDSEDTSDISWALEGVSDRSMSSIAENMALGRTAVDTMYSKYLFTGE